jgi:hypothetical protein
MALFWLCYRKSGRLAGVVIADSSSLIYARLRATLDGTDAGTDYAEGHMLNERLSGLVQRPEIGRMLSPKEAQSILDRFDKK